MLIVPKCIDCKHIKFEGRGNCEAFPEGIPSDIGLCRVDVEELSECANGIRFEKRE